MGIVSHIILIFWYLGDAFYNSSLIANLFLILSHFSLVILIVFFTFVYIFKLKSWFHCSLSCPFSCIFYISTVVFIISFFYAYWDFYFTFYNSFNCELCFFRFLLFPDANLYCHEFSSLHCFYLSPTCPANLCFHFYCHEVF